ncbi:MAG TPA: inositol monophosphatase family protein [Acidimicrobiales bacterium]|nr:inositol monophosphatase family protein [Acidimicrobiales bacterium]
MPVDTELLEIALDITRRAGQMTLQWFQSSSLTIERKRDGTPVTEADRAAEAFIRDELRRRFPDDSIVGEEFADHAGSSDRTWYVDPIDGTKAFSHGVPLYSNLLALFDASGCSVGVINIPALDEVVCAGRGLGCFYNGATCRVSDTDSLDGAYVTTSGLGNWPPSALPQLLDAGCNVRTWGDGYGYLLVATGRVDAMVDHEVKPYDVAPMPVILREAGGRFSDFAGASRHDGGSSLATNGRLHDDLLALLT